MHPWHKDGSPRRMIVALFHVRQSDRFARPHRTQTLWLETFRLFSDRPVPDDQPILPLLFPLSHLVIGFLPQKGIDLPGFPLLVADQGPQPFGSPSSCFQPIQIASVVCTSVRSGLLSTVV